jgi:DNA-binding protein HU-beta
MTFCPIQNIVVESKFSNKLPTMRAITMVSGVGQSMNKQDMIEWVHGKIGGTKVQAEEVVNGLLDAIVGTLKKGEEVSIAGLGIFSVKPRAARMARNPKTGEQVSVPATKVPKFRAAKALKDAVK